MVVYVAKRHWDYEGFDIIGVFSNEKDANDKCLKDMRGDYHSVECHSVK